MILPAAVPPPPPVDALVTVTAPAAARALDPQARQLIAGSTTYRVRLPAGTDLVSVRRRAGVVAVEPNRVRRARAATDPLRSRQGWLTRIGWTPPTSRRRPVVAVLDTGVDASHPDLRGVVDTVDSKTFVGGSSIRDTSGHGTHVAGIIAAQTGNGIGGSGVARARILSVKIANGQGDADTASMVAGIEYAIAQRVQVINISLGGPDPSDLERAAINKAIRAGIVVVAASGNNGRNGNEMEYPGAYRHVIAVGALRSDDNPWVDSARGPHVTLAAPGTSIVSTALRGRYRARTGTSMASAVVSGVAARLLAKHPTLRPDQVAEILRRSADDVSTVGRDDATGAGRVNIVDALAAGIPPRDRKTEPDDDPALITANPPLLPQGQYAARGIGTLRQWYDPSDDFKLPLQAGQRVAMAVNADAGLDPDIVIWKPGAPAYVQGPQYTRDWLAASSLSAGPTEAMTFTATASGDYSLEVRGAAGGGRYDLVVRRDDIPPPG